MAGRRREIVRAIAFVLLAAAVVWLGTHLKKAGQAAPARTGASLGWPWLPGGALAPRAAFRAVGFAVHATPDAAVPSGVSLIQTPGQQGVVYQVPGQPALWTAPAKEATVLRGTARTHTLSVDGHRYVYVRVLSMLATAYNGSVAMNGPWGGVAAWNGEPLQHGDVAVDPRVIPLGSHLYVAGYGPALAADTGSGIVGDRIDLYFAEPAPTISQFGQRMVKVYVLAPAGT